VRGVEALTRFFAEPQQGPDVWFAEAAEVGMGVDLELRAAFLALGALQRLPEGIYLSLNLSPEALISPRFREVLPDIPAGRLVVEITEHAPVDDYAVLREPIAELRARGGRLAVDDVGAGFASLRHILKLDPDVIKLDIGLTRHVDSDPGVRAVAAALIAFASEFGASVVSEGIETEEEAQSLRELGVSVGQGYGLGRPVPIEQLFPEARGHHALPFRPGGAARGSVDEALREPIPRVGHG
jgi:EAL domain-containing protein (putative c-di-GMP-specific phosphodiesterase class I)